MANAFFVSGPSNHPDFRPRAGVLRMCRSGAARAALGMIVLGAVLLGTVLLGTVLLLAPSAAHAQDAPPRETVRRLVHQPAPPTDSAPPLPPAPPAPPAATNKDPAIRFAADGSDLYECWRGSAVRFASEYRAFETRYRPDGIDEREGYVAAQDVNVPLPAAPPAKMVPGYVMLRVAVAPNGKVSDALVVCSTDAYFNDAAAAAVRSATFVPATARGVAVASVETVEYWYPRF